MNKSRKKSFQFSVLSFELRNGGQTTLEVLIALTLLTIALTSAVLVVTSGQSLSTDSQESGQALRLAQRNIESSISSAKANFSALASSTIVDGEFTKTVVVSTIDANTKQVVSRVSWSTDPLRAQQVELTTLVTNWSDVQNTGGDTGGGGTSGNWCNPTTFGTVNLGSGEQATGIDTIGTTTYMTATASSQSKPDFFVIDVSSSSNPSITGSVDTGPGLNALNATSHYAYVADNKTSKQFQVIDISDKSNPVLVASTTLTSNSEVARSIFYYNQKVYIGTDNDGGDEFQIIDVSTPTSPVILGRASLSKDVTSIYVSGNKAYLGTSDRSKDLQIFDVTTSSAPTLLGTYDIPGDGETRSLYAVGNKMYVGRETGGDEFYVLDITNATSVSVLGHVSIGNTVNAITVRDNYAFLATSDTNNELKILNISDLSNITSCSNFNFPNIATGVDFDNNLVYTAVRSNDGLRIVTSQ